MALERQHGHHLDRSEAIQIINTMYVVFLGVVFNVLFVVSGQIPVRVRLVIDAEHALIPIFLLVYFLLNWLYWNALFRRKPWVRDYWVLLSILGIISLGTSFILAISSDFLERKATLVAFLAYAVLSFQDDVWLMGAATRAWKAHRPTAPAFLYSRLVLGAGKIVCAAFLGWGFVFLTLDKPELISCCLEKMRMAVIGFACVKLIDYLLLTNWPPAHDVLRSVEDGLQDTAHNTQEDSGAD